MSTEASPEKVLSSDLIYDGRVVHFYVDKVELPTGKTTKREWIRHNGAVAIVPIDADGNVILVEQWRHAAGRKLLEIPAGGLEKGESPDDCAVRELQEEIGHKPGHLQRIGGIFLAPGYSSEFIYLYIAQDLTESRLNMDDDESIQVLRLPLEEVLRQIMAGEIQDAKTVSGMMLAQNWLGK